MRLTLLAATALLPVSLMAQYPAVGTYKGYVQPVGTDGRFDLFLKIEQAADSTVIKLYQDLEQPPFPLASQQVISGGFEIEFFQLSCPMVVVGEEWEGICSDPLGTPSVALRFPRKPEPPAPAATPPTSG
jgi:hypothetical protein